MHKGIYFENINALELKSQWGHSGTKKSCWIRIFASISYKTNTMHKISSKKVYKRRTLKSGTIFGSWKPFKNDEKWFLFHLKSSFLSQDIQFFVLTFGYVEKQFDQKDRVNFKIYDVTNWLTKNCNTHTGQ